MKKRSKTNRQKVENPGLNKRYNSRIKQEYMDQEYASELSPEHQKWLSDFNEEYYGANLDFEELENNRFHKTEQEKKDCTDRNNARNRCVYGHAKAGNRLDSSVNISYKDDNGEEISRKIDSFSVNVRSNLNVEDAIIEVLDFKTQQEASSEAEAIPPKQEKQE